MNKKESFAIHRSAIFVFVLSLLLFVLANFPGQRRVTKFIPWHRCIEIEEELQHGWPFVYSHREFEEFFLPPLAQHSNIWTPWSSVTEFSASALFVNVVVALILAGVVASFFQFRQRRILQIRLADLLIVMAILAAVFAWGNKIYVSDNRELRAIEQLNIHTYRPRNSGTFGNYFIHSQFANAHTEPSVPFWFNSLEVLPRFSNVIGLRTTIGKDEQTSLLGGFRHL